MFSLITQLNFVNYQTFAIRLSTEPTAIYVFIVNEQFYSRINTVNLLALCIKRGNILIILKVEVAKVEILSPFPFKYKPVVRATLEII
jgi:hypothetical protein